MFTSGALLHARWFDQTEHDGIPLQQRVIVSPQLMAQLKQPLTHSLQFELGTPSLKFGALPTVHHLRMKVFTSPSSLAIQSYDYLSSLLPTLFHARVVNVGMCLSHSILSGITFEVTQLEVRTSVTETETGAWCEANIGVISSKVTVLSIESSHTHTTLQSSSIPHNFPRSPTEWYQRVATRVYGYQSILEECIDSIWHNVRQWQDDVASFHSNTFLPSLPLSAFSPRSFLFHGLSGTGKTHLVRSLCGTSGLPWFFVSAASLLHRTEGKSEEGMIQLVQRARNTGKPAFVVIDEIDTILPRTAGSIEEDAHVDEEEDDVTGGGLKDDSKDGWVLGNTRVEWRLASVLKQLLRECGDIDTTVALASTHGATNTAVTLASPPAPIYFIFTTTSPKSLDLCGFRQSPYMDQEFELKALKREERVDGLQMIMTKMKFEEELADGSGASTPSTRSAIFTRLASELHGYVGADLDGLVREILLAAIRRTQRSSIRSGDKGGGALAIQAAEIVIRQADCEEVLEWFRPSNLQQLEFRMTTTKDAAVGSMNIDTSSMEPLPVEAFASYFSSLAGIMPCLSHLHYSFLLPLKQPQLYHTLWRHRLGMRASRGVLLYGHSGGGKTQLAMCLARACGLNSIVLPATSLANKVLGASEKTLADVFRKARASAPSLLILDQLENVAPRRKGLVRSQTRLTSDSDDDEEEDPTDQHEADSYERLLSVLLVELDGVLGKDGGSSQDQVYIVATSSEPDRIDPALLRPARLDTHVHIPPPDQAARLEILKLYFKSTPILVEVDQYGKILMPEQFSLTYVLLPPEIQSRISPSPWSRTVDSNPVDPSSLSPSSSDLRDLFLLILSHLTLNYSGADLVSLHRESAMHALRRSIASQLVHSWTDCMSGAFRHMVGSIRPDSTRHPFQSASVSQQQATTGTNSNRLFTKKSQQEIANRNATMNALAASRTTEALSSSTVSNAFQFDFQANTDVPSTDSKPFVFDFSSTPSSSTTTAPTSSAPFVFGAPSTGDADPAPAPFTFTMGATTSSAPAQAAAAAAAPSSASSHRKPLKDLH